MRVCSTRRSVGRLLILLGALAGLFAMHGMSDHGTGGPVELTAASSHDSHMLGMDAPSHAPVGEEPQPNHHDSGLAGLCLAVLIAVLTFGVGVLRRRLRALASWLPRTYVHLLGFSPERVPRPPDLLALSIQRC
jgi:hypothetical protein